ncbi:hypothetical protein L7F22_004485 [Adiantum nelumboides]|nr:hypothetical protein [Adiantum nelumboides]
MGSPPLRNAVPHFTPSHHLKDRLRSFTDFLLSNVDEWNNPHPLCLSPPPPFSFPGSDRFIKGRLPHRTVAISASLSSLFSDVDTFKPGDGSVSSIDHVAHINNDVGHAPCIPVDDRSTTPALTHSESPKQNLKLDLLLLQADGSSQGSHPRAPQATSQSYMVKTSSVICLEDHNRSACLQNADSLQLPPSHGTLAARSEVMPPAVGHSNGGSVVVAVERLLDSQCNSAVTRRGLHDSSVEPPVIPEQTNDLEEGELAERFSDDEQLPIMEDANVEGEGSPEGSGLQAHMQRCSPSGSSSPEKRILELDTDEEMNEPISLFVSRHHMGTKVKLANQILSAVNSSSDLLTKKVLKKVRTEEKQHVLEKSLIPIFGSNSEQVKILLEGLSRVSTATKENDGKRLSSLQNGSILVSEQSILDRTNNVRMDEAMGTLNKPSIQEAYAGMGQPEIQVGMFSSVSNDGIYLPTFEEGIDVKLASQEGVRKKTKKGPLTEARRKKKQRAKHKANERKLAKSGICKLKFEPYIDKTEQRQKRTCSYYVQGKCSMGASCLFAHDVEPRTTSEMCKYFVNNCCLKGDDCPFSHTLASFPCKPFHTRGHCKAGESCRFSHEPMSEEAKSEFLQKIKEEARMRHGVSDGKCRAGLKVATLPDKSSSSKAKAQVKDKAAGTDFMQTNSDSYVAVKNRTFTSSSAPFHAVNKCVKNPPFGSGFHDKVEPSPDGGHLKSSQATGMERVGQLGSVAMSCSGATATTQERRRNAEVFLRAQLEQNRFVQRKLAANLENLDCQSSKQPGPLPLGHATPITVSSMSALCKLDMSPTDFPGCHQQRASNKKLLESGAPVSESSPTLLDLLLRPQEETLSKKSASTSTSQPTDIKMACKRSSSNVFLDRFLQ